MKGIEIISMLKTWTESAYFSPKRNVIKYEEKPRRIKIKSAPVTKIIENNLVWFSLVSSTFLENNVMAILVKGENKPLNPLNNLSALPKIATVLKSDNKPKIRTGSIIVEIPEIW